MKPSPLHKRDDLMTAVGPPARDLEREIDLGMCVQNDLFHGVLPDENRGVSSPVSIAVIYFFLDLPLDPLFSALLISLRASIERSSLLTGAGA